MIIKITDRHADRLARMRPTPVKEAMADQLDASAEALLTDAQASIMEGSGGGRVSAPHEPPNNQTGVLHDSGYVAPAAEVAAEIKAAAGFSAPYSVYLEFGTSRMEPRPFLVPATERQRGDTFKALSTRFRQIVGLR